MLPIHRPYVLQPLLALALASCVVAPQAPAPAPRAPTPTVALPRAPATPAAASATASATASVAPSVALSAELTSAPALIYRELNTGALPGRTTLVTHRLQRAANQALLTVETRSSENNGATLPVSIEPLGPPTVRRFAGTWTSTGAVTTFELSDGTESRKLVCEQGRVQVAAATAVRKREGRGGCEGDRGQWTPRATKRVEALRCGINHDPPDPAYRPDRFEEQAFVPAPGVEFLFVNDDCVMQGGGYRFIPADGSVYAVRATR